MWSQKQSLLSRREVMTSRIQTLRTQRVSICRFIEQSRHYDENTKKYLVPAYMDLEEVSYALTRYKERLQYIDEEIRELTDVAWDTEICDKEYD